MSHTFFVGFFGGYNEFGHPLFRPLRGRTRMKTVAMEETEGGTRTL